MANLTVAIDDALLHRARQRALDNGTSVNALVRSYLETYAGEDEMDQRREIVRIARKIRQPLNYSTRDWSRDDLHNRDALR